MSNNHKLKSCSNCNYEFGDVNNFCPKCGQKNHSLNIPLTHLIEEVIENTLHLDSKSFRTILLLIIKPGFLSKEYNGGKRMNFIPPIRLYVFISFVFFFLIGIKTTNHTENPYISNEAKREKSTSINMNVTYFGINSNDLTGLNISQADSVYRNLKIKNTGFNKFVFWQLYKFGNNSPSEIYHSFFKNISYMMFVLMPVFGVLLLLLYKKKTGYYINSLTIAVHFQSFIFLLFIICLLLGMILNTFVWLGIGIVVFPGYLFFMLRTIFEESIPKTLIKTTFICIAYTILLLTTIIISVLIIAAFI